MATKTIEQLEAELAEAKRQLENALAENGSLRDQLEAGAKGNARETAIAAKINESGGALSRAQAIQALDNQAAHNATAKKARK